MTTHPKVRFLDRTTPPHILTLILLAGMSALNMSIFLPSLNQMATYFDTDYAVMQLAVSGYLAATAVVQVFVGPISDRFGRRPVVLVSLAVFVLATLGCYASTSVGMFLFFRVLQSIVASLMVLSRAIVRDMVPQEQAASMIGYVTMGMALVPMLGPTIGGALDQAFGWSSVFLLLALVGTGVFALCYVDQGETIVGKGLSFSEQRRGYPELLTSPRFWGYVGCAAFGSGAFFALLGGASFVAQGVFGLSPMMTGVALGTPAVGYLVGNGLSGRFAIRLGINKMALIGTLVSSAGMALSLLLLLWFHHPLAFFGPCTLLGLGNGLMLPNATAGTLSVRPRLAGTASGLGGAIMIGGGAALSALAGAMLTEETGTWPLQIIMLLTSLCGTASIWLVIRRERSLGL